MNKEKVKTASYIQERIAIKQSDYKKIRDEWLKVVRLPKHYEEQYYKVYKKNEEDFYNCLTPPYEIEEDSIGWVKEAEIILSTWQEINGEKIRSKLPDTLFKHPFIGFSYGFVAYYKKNNTPSNPIIKQASTERVVEIVLENSTKVLLEELWEYKTREINKNINSKECFIKFCDQMKTRKWVEALFDKYPLIFKNIILQCNRSIDFYRDVEVHLYKDYMGLKKIFHISGELQSIRYNAGDSHNGKRQVLILNFESGKILYKPRSLAIDEGFAKILDFINHNLKIDLKIPTVLNCCTYGWQEFIEKKACKNQEEIKEYYRKMGMFSCLFYIFMASDMHMENVISCGSNPVFIDLESLFQGYKGRSYVKHNVYEKVLTEIRDSILSTCLFPGHMDPSNNRDLSGLTGQGGQCIPNAKYVFENLYTSNMKIVREDYTIEDKQNIPEYKGNKVEPRKFVKELVEGFQQLFDFIVAHKNKFIMENGLLRVFYNCPVRTIMRDTAKYGILLKAATEPKYLTDAIYRQKLFDRLWLMAEENHGFEKIIPYEIQDLMEGDVPYFYSYIYKDSLYSGRGDEIKNYYDQPMIETVKEKIRMLDVQAKEKQVNFIKLSMEKPVKRWEIREQKQDYSVRCQELSETLNKDIVLQENHRIITMIEEMAYHDKINHDIGWIDLRITSGGQWAFLPMDNTIYQGILGIGLFVAQYYRFTKNEKYKQILKDIVCASHKFDASYRNRADLSAFNGCLAVAYAYYYIGIILEDESLKKEAVKLVLLCESLIKKDRAYDIISGSAGALIIALRMNEREHNGRLMKFAVECGNHLMDGAIHEEGKFGWYTAAGNNVILAGMSHGNAGIAWALAELYKATGIKKCRDYCKMALEYENTLYNLYDNNWIDMRSRENRINKGFAEPVNWCHGAPGIGLSRILTKDIFQSFVPEKDIHNAIVKTMKDGFGGSDCLCHGSLGNIEILLKAAEYYKDPEIESNAKKIAYDLIKTAKVQEWICGIPQKTLVPGFMTGLSGIGYNLLRTLEPNKVPCVLTFELPEE